MIDLGKISVGGALVFASAASLARALGAETWEQALSEGDAIVDLRTAMSRSSKTASRLRPMR